MDQKQLEALVAKCEAEIEMLYADYEAAELDWHEQEERRIKSYATTEQEALLSYEEKVKADPTYTREPSYASLNRDAWYDYALCNLFDGPARNMSTIDGKPVWRLVLGMPVVLEHDQKERYVIK